MLSSVLRSPRAVQVNITDGRIARCGCEDREWGSIPESRVSGHTGIPNSTWLMLKHDGSFQALDRKPIGRVKQQVDRLSRR